VAADVNPGGRVVAQSGTAGLMNFLEDVPNQNMAAQAISTVGGSQPHTNIQPYLCVNFIISLFGIFPSPS
jgi:microcystin-dependent protein